VSSTIDKGGAPAQAPAHTERPDARPTILIGFADALAAIEVAWSLQSAGFRVVAFRRAGQRPPLRRVRGVELIDVPAPELDARGAVRAVARAIETTRPAAVLPMDDHAVWVCSRIEQPHAPIAGPTGAAAELALDKSLQISAAQRAGLPVPATRVLDDPRDFGPIDSPVIVKAARPVVEVAGALVRPTAVVCADAAELAAAAQTSWHGPVLVQPLIHGVGEGVFGHAGAAGVTQWSGHKRVRMVNPQGSASSACRSCDVGDELIGPAKQFMTESGWRGMFMLEFLRDANGTPWFMELNGRAWGSMALARRRGFEYPSWTVRAALDPEFEPPVRERPPHVTCRNLGLELVHLAFVAKGPQSDALVEWPKLRTSVREVCRLRTSDRWYNWNRSQPDVLAADTAATLASYARKIARRRR
jgi:biotin carboxylase